MIASENFRKYITDIQQNLKLGNATEHTHRPTLKVLLESAYHGITATNEPGRIECGAPDFSISTDSDFSQLTIGYIEAKDVDVDLAAIEADSKRANPSTPNGKQLKRYIRALPNLILTNYTDFRWYTDGEFRMAARLAEHSDGKLSVGSDDISRADEILSAFLSRSPESVSSSMDLAKRMARLTHMVRDIVQEGMSKGRASLDVNDLYQATKQTLVPNLALVDFADMFAQTLAYGLFVARVNHKSGNFYRRTAVYSIPRANPFLRQLFNLVAGPNSGKEPFIGFVDDLAQLLANSDMEAILVDFGKRNVRQDPIMHFYETFLEAYDPKLRESRGVYYTPEPVISYIVRSVDHLLKERFGCVEGLADYQQAEYEVVEQVDGEEKKVTKQAHRVLVLDPACGTGSFLYAVVDHIRQYYRDGGNAGMWDTYVRDHLLSRIYGFELMMAPYAMAHLKLGMQLAAQDMPQDERINWSYDFGNDERLGVYLTNSLEQAEQQTATLFGPMRAITDEANAASEIKRDLPIMVVLGNPPYSGRSSNPSRRGRKLTWIGKLIEDYKEVDGKPLGERNPKWLQDDYVKFIRFGQWRISQSGAGILAFITNNGYLNNPTFRGMRQQLMDTFTDIYLLDLHGNSNKKERAPDGSADQNVFDIKPGVSIAIFVKEPGKRGPASVKHADLYGVRESKYRVLSETDISSTNWETLEPTSPNYIFKPWNDELELEHEYYKWPAIKEVIPLNRSGVTTARDSLTIQWSREEMMDVVRDFSALDREEAMNKYNLKPDSEEWRVQWAQADLNEAGIREDLVKPVLYRPFDTRYTYYTGASGGFIGRPRSQVMRHMLAGDNLGLISCRRQTEAGLTWNRIGVTNTILDECTISNKTSEINYLYPLYTYPSEQEIDQGLYAPTDRQPNISSQFTSELERKLGMRFNQDGHGDLESTFGPEDVLHYIYAVFHSPTYRERYDQFLRYDFPRVPIPNDAIIFRTLARLGRRLTDTHLMNSTQGSASPVSFPITGDNVIESAHPKYYAPDERPPGEAEPLETGRVYISKNNQRSGKRGQYFDGLSSEVWEFRIGGYQPMDKWLKDRKGRTISFDDLDHYRRIATAIEETILLMKEVDATIIENGGLW